MDEGDVTRSIEDLLAREVAGDLPPFLPFWGHAASADHPGRWVLSQWWPSPFTIDGTTYATAEACLMAGKARLFGDHEAEAGIVAAEHPAVAKDLGRRVRGFDEATWVAHRLDLAVDANLAKFGQDPALGAYLASTAPRVLVEASPRDRIWGIGLGAGDPRAERPSEWRGTNLLGFVLVEVRRRLVEASPPR